MNKKLIKDKYKEKIKLIRIYNQKYYNENQPEIHDDKYDETEHEITPHNYITKSLYEATCICFTENQTRRSDV